MRKFILTGMALAMLAIPGRRFGGRAALPGADRDVHGQPAQGLDGQFSNVWRHEFKVTINPCDGTFSGVAPTYDNGASSPTWIETVTGTFGKGTVSFAAVPAGRRRDVQGDGRSVRHRRCPSMTTGLVYEVTNDRCRLRSTCTELQEPRRVRQGRAAADRRGSLLHRNADQLQQVSNTDDRMVGWPSGRPASAGPHTEGPSLEGDGPSACHPAGGVSARAAGAAAVLQAARDLRKASRRAQCALVERGPLRPSSPGRPSVDCGAAGGLEDL